MKADFQGSHATVPPAANGVHREAKKPPASKRAANGERPAPLSMAGPFATAAPEPIDAPMWPLHSSMWFQPERAPSTPPWSGLAIERRNRPAAPDFAPSGVEPFERPGIRYTARDALQPAADSRIPRSDLAPVGWDARVLSRKEGRE